MKWLWIILLILLAIVVLIMFLRVRIKVDFYHDNDDDHLMILITALFGIIKYKMNVPMIKVADDSTGIVFKEKVETGQQEKVKSKDKKKYTSEDLLNNLKDVKQLFLHVVGLSKIVRKFLRKITIEEFEWKTTVGLDDAAYTGMLTGAFWAMKGSIVGFLSILMKLPKKPTLNVIPEFNQLKSETHLTCIIYFRIGHAIFAGLKIFKYWVGGKPKFQGKTLSQLVHNRTNSV